MNLTGTFFYSLFVVLILLNGCQEVDQRQESSQKSGADTQTAFTVKLLDEARLTKIIENRNERILLLNVWATWCPSCHVEHPFLNRLAERGIRLVGINYKDEDGAARRWLTEKGNPFVKNIVDSDGRLGMDLGVTGAPETYVVDAQGVVRFRFQGPLSERVWRQHFEPLLRELGEAVAG